MAGKIRPSPRTKNEFQNSYAFIIGINEYSNGVPALRSAENDARRLAELLTEKHNYITQLFVETVTKAALQTLFSKTLPALIQKHDRVLIYFAGHGIALEAEDSPQGYLLPQDAKPEDSDTFLAMSKINEWLAGLNCRHLLVILDCCFAGTFRWASTRDVTRLPSVIYKETYKRFVREPAWQVLTSTAYDQKALDTVVGKISVRDQTAEQQPHSPFALALFDALEGKADVIPVDGGDGIITATELFVFMRDQVERGVAHYHNQTPGLWPLRREYDKGEFIFLDPNGEMKLKPAPSLTFANNPYRGLEAYNEQHKELFFGRSELILQLAEQVDRSSLTVVLGASGTGKSSLVKAGLLPYLRKAGYHILKPLHPTAHPAQALDDALRSGLTFVQPIPSSISLRGLLARWRQHNAGKKLLLVIDQFEELITKCDDESEKNSFVQTLGQLLREADFLHLVITLRSEFESQFSGMFGALWQEGVRFVVPPMSQTELREVIVRPAAEYALYFEPSDLVDVLISSVWQMPGALSFLSLTLSELYRRSLEKKRGDRALRREDYDELGGVSGVLQTHAEQMYEGFSAENKQDLKHILLRMIALDRMTRRRVKRQELVYRDKKENERINQLVSQLEQARLLVVDGDQDGNRYIEPAHDALVSWEVLYQWQLQAMTYLPLQRRVALSAEDWHNEPDETQKAGLLWHDDSRLPIVARLLPTDINKEVSSLRQFVDRAVQMVDRLRLSSAPPDEERWLNALEIDFTWQSVQRRWRDTRRIWTAVSLAFLAIFSLAVVSIFFEDQASERANDLQTRQVEVINLNTNLNIANDNLEKRQAELAIEVQTRTAAEAEAIQALHESQAQRFAEQSLTNAENNPTLALLLAAESGKLSETSLGYKALNTIVFRRAARTMSLQTAGSISLVKWSYDDSKIFAASGSEIVVWNAKRGEKVLSIETDLEIKNFSLHTDEKRLLTTHDKKISVWNIYSDLPLLEIESESSIRQANWILTSNQIAISSEDRFLIYDVDSTEIITEIELTSGSQLVEWSNDANRLIIQSQERGFEVQDISEGQIIFECPYCLNLDLSPSGAYVVLDFVARNQQYQIANLNSGQVFDLETYLLQTDYHWSPDGMRLLLIGTDRKVRIWEENEPLQHEIYHPGGTGNARWSANGELLFTTRTDDRNFERSSLENRARDMLVWSMSTGKVILTLTDVGRQMIPNYKNQQFLEITDNEIAIWHAMSPPFSFEEGTQSVMWNADGSMVITVPYAGSVTLRDNDNLTPLLTTIEADNTTQTGWNTRGNKFFVTNVFGISIWDAITKEKIVDYPLSRLYNVYWSDDDTKLAITTFDDTIYLVNAVREEVLWHKDIDAYKVNWASHGRTVVIQSYLYDVSVFDAISGAKLAQIEKASDTTINDIDGQILVIHEQMQADGTFQRVLTSIDYDNVTILEHIPSEYQYFGNSLYLYDESVWSYNNSHIILTARNNRIIVMDNNSGDIKYEHDAVWNSWWLPNKNVIAYSTDEGISLWNVDTNQSMITLAGDMNPEKFSWNSDASQFATNHGSIVKIWGKDGNHLFDLPHNFVINHTVWSLDNQRIITTELPELHLYLPIFFRIWDAHTGEMLLEDSYTSEMPPIPLTTPSQILISSESSPMNVLYRQYFTNISDYVDAACQRVTRNLIWSEWELYVGDEPYRCTCSDLPIPSSVIYAIEQNQATLADNLMCGNSY